MWNDKQTELVYNPRRFDIVIVRGPETPGVEEPLAAEGYRPISHNRLDGRLWVRDRVQRAREALHRMDRQPVPARTLERDA